MELTKVVDEHGFGCYPPQDYTGIWEVYWPNGVIKSRNRYIDGKEEGEQLCFWDNGNLAQVGQAKNGHCIGLWEDFSYEGLRFKETDYYSDGNFQNRFYDPIGNLYSISEWSNDRPRKAKNFFVNTYLKIWRLIFYR
ncbi:toxin-antitoxin system YwqK family antitoxin [Desulfatibacillum aliphaticivorans]|uniref:toxin-antitoxin system YwqK family antitoxin n=1 Tax=Desulfatibacillum aliphaticivorans TaxID=218208 RepID=UPI0012F9F83F|nr:hypothetical protein [Desulfatibacillum aliphaticivorans]